MNTLQLPNKLVSQLIKHPQTGMGYQLVKVILKSGKELVHHKVVNGSLLVLDNNQHLTNNDIASIEAE